MAYSKGKKQKTKNQKPFGERQDGGITRDGLQNKLK